MMYLRASGGIGLMPFAGAWLSFHEINEFRRLAAARLRGAIELADELAEVVREIVGHFARKMLCFTRGTELNFSIDLPARLSSILPSL
jgi:hypothetical protein